MAIDGDKHNFLVQESAQHPGYFHCAHLSLEGADNGAIEYTRRPMLGNSYTDDRLWLPVGVNSASLTWRYHDANPDWLKTWSHGGDQERAGAPRRGDHPVGVGEHPRAPDNAATVRAKAAAGA